MVVGLNLLMVRKFNQKVGSIIFFPATWTYIHRGYTTKVPKYIVNGWIYARPNLIIDIFHTYAIIVKNVPMDEIIYEVEVDICARTFQIKK